MIFNAKEQKLELHNMQIDYITFGEGTKSLIMIQGLNTRGIKGAAMSLAYMYRVFAKDYKVYLFDRRPAVQEGITVRDMAVKMYSDAYVKRYKPFMPLLTILQKPKDVQRFVILANACLTCNSYEELDKIQCPVFVIGGQQDKVVSGNASEEIARKLDCKIYMYDDLGHAAYEEAKDFNKRIYDFLKG